MKKHVGLSVFSVIAGIAAFALRFLQNKSGFEPNTGLPIPGNLFGIALVGLLVISALIFLCLSRSLHTAVSFPGDFSTTNAGLLTLPVMGIFLMLVSGLLDAAAILMPDVIPGTNTISSLTLIFAATAILPALSLFPAIAVCRTHTLQESDKPTEDVSDAPVENRVSLAQTLLLIVPVCLVVRLVLVYRAHSINPSLEAYYVELLALILLTLTFFRLSACAVQSTPLSRFALYTGLSVVLVLAAMADPLSLSARLLYGGCALVLFGFLLLQLFRSSQRA